MYSSDTLHGLGNELKTERKSKGLSLHAVAKPAKISATYLQKLESGIVKNPSPRVLNRIAEVLEVSYSKLMKLAGYILPAPLSTGTPDKADLPKDTLYPGDLSAEELKAVAAFIAYLKAQRKDV